MRIGEVSQRLHIGEDTIRYYEREGVLPQPRRDALGHRDYTEEDLEFLDALIRLKETGMSLADIAKFTHWVQGDPDFVAERLQLLRGHRESILAQQEVLNRALSVIDHKIEIYSSRLDP